MSRHQDIYAVVCEIPEGRVATYGQIARLANLLNGARQVGYALAALHGEHDVPWHRVINAAGKVSNRSTPGHEHVQQFLLEEEGVEFDSNRTIKLEEYVWRA